MSTQAAQENVEGRNNGNDSSLLSFEEIHAHGENDQNQDTSVVHTILTQDLNILNITDPGLNESANLQEQSDEGNISTPLKQEPNMSIIVESDISESIEKSTIDTTIQEEPKTVPTSTPTTLDKLLVQKGAYIISTPKLKELTNKTKIKFTDPEILNVCIMNAADIRSCFTKNGIKYSKKDHIVEELIKSFIEHLKKDKNEINQMQILKRANDRLHESLNRAKIIQEQNNTFIDIQKKQIQILEESHAAHLVNFKEASKLIAEQDASMKKYFKEESQISNGNVKTPPKSSSLHLSATHAPNPYENITPPDALTTATLQTSHPPNPKDKTMITPQVWGNSSIPRTSLQLNLKPLMDQEAIDLLRSPDSYSHTVNRPLSMGIIETVPASQKNEASEATPAPPQRQQSSAPVNGKFFRRYKPRIFTNSVNKNQIKMKNINN